MATGRSSGNDYSTKLASASDENYTACLFCTSNQPLANPSWLAISVQSHPLDTLCTTCTCCALDITQLCYSNLPSSSAVFASICSSLVQFSQTSHVQVTERIVGSRRLTSATLRTGCAHSVFPLQTVLEDRDEGSTCTSLRVC
jgi:hypothetical protein